MSLLKRKFPFHLSEITAVSTMPRRGIFMHSTSIYLQATWVKCFINYLHNISLPLANISLFVFEIKLIIVIRCITIKRDMEIIREKKPSKWLNMRNWILWEEMSLMQWVWSSRQRKKLHFYGGSLNAIR